MEQKRYANYSHSLLSLVTVVTLLYRLGAVTMLGKVLVLFLAVLLGFVGGDHRKYVVGASAETSTAETLWYS